MPRAHIDLRANLAFVARSTRADRLACVALLFAACSNPSSPASSQTDTIGAGSDSEAVTRQPADTSPTPDVGPSETIDAAAADSTADATVATDTDTDATPDTDTNPAPDISAAPDQTASAQDSSPTQPDTGASAKDAGKPPACQPAQCSDGNPCTTDSCDPATGCQHVANSAPCDDGNACTNKDICAKSKCSGKKISCNDGNSCTTDACAPSSGCQHKAKSGACNDGNPCTINDACSASKCKGKAKPCDDGKPCTADKCVPAKGCVHGPDCKLPLVCGAGAKKNVCAKPPPLPYPKRTAWSIKAIQPDFWPNRKEIIGNKAGGIAANIVWSAWQPVAKKPPCKTGKEVAYDGWCFKIDANLQEEIAAYSKAGLVVSGIFWGVPEWARIAAKNCSPAGGNPAFKQFCAPKKAADFGRFVGFIADRFDGLHGVGRVADFVIHNEVNANTWFDIGCGSGKACDVTKWLDVYAANYNAAYDRVTKHQPQARVLISLMHAWDKKHDKPKADSPILSGQTFLQGFAKRVGKRAWRVAWHPYPSNLLSPVFDALDHDKHGKVTYGNPGVLVGWLRKHFPSVPSAWEVQFTESGVNSLGPQSNNSAQADGVCRSLVNALATPGITNYIYHRMKDHPVEVAQGLGVGLWTAKGKNKPAWSTWALCNRKELKPSKLACGFQHLPYVLLRRGYAKGKGHWASSRLLPAGFKKEKTWRLHRDKKPGTKLLFECQVDKHNLLSADPTCEKLTPLGPVGWIFTKPAKGLVPLHRCRIGPGTDHFVSSHAKCEGQILEQTLGWALPGG